MRCWKRRGPREAEGHDDRTATKPERGRPPRRDRAAEGERNAVILAHYYQKPAIQDLADFVGDSLDLSRKAAATDADVIAFCGVRFMAETAKILSPEKTVILPDMDAGCSLEDCCPPDQFKAFREAHPDHIALTYINCSAAVKALSRHHRHVVVGGHHPQADPDGPEDHLRPRPASGRLSGAADRARHAAVAGRVHRPPGVQRDRAFETEGRASGRAGRGASRMPAAHHRPCRSCRLDPVDPRVRAVEPGARRSWSRPSRISFTRWRKPRRARRSSACRAATATATATCARIWPSTRSRNCTSALRDLKPRIELSDEVMAAARMPLERMLDMAGRTVGQGDVGRPQISGD